MAYAQIDVGAPRHVKLLPLSDGAKWLWLVALCHCQEHLTDGFVADEVIPLLTTLVNTRPTTLLVKQLTRARLWVRSEGGYQIHDYLVWNASREKVQHRRAKWRAKRQGQGGGTQGTPPETGVLDSDPVPKGVPVPQRNATQRSTDQKQDQEHPAGAGPLRLVASTVQKPEKAPRPKDPPKPKLLAEIAKELLRIYPDLTGPDLTEALKAQAAQMKVAYDSESVRIALDGVEFYQAKVARAREQQA